jgi:hypothetical protein
MSKKLTLLSIFGILLIFALPACEKKTGVSETAETEDVTVSLTPATEEVEGAQFSLQLSDLKIVKTIDKTTKEMTATPHLRGSIKIKNTSKDILEIQGITIQYLDASGNVIPFKSGEKNVTVSIYLRDLQPGKESDNFLDVTVPMAAIKEKSLSKIQTTLVYVPTPLKRESVEMGVKL